MKSVQEIRLANLRLLLDECGSGRGAASKLAVLTGVKAPYISQLRNIRDHSGGKRRTMGDDTARKLEVGMEKPYGWMDTDHGPAQTHDEAQLVDSYRMLTKGQREKLMGMAEELAELNAAATANGMPPSEDRPGRKSPPH
jgi:hypothetical protein